MSAYFDVNLIAALRVSGVGIAALLLHVHCPYLSSLLDSPSLWVVVLLFCCLSTLWTRTL